MNDKFKNFFSATKSVAKRSTVVVLCMVLVGVFATISCNKPIIIVDEGEVKKEDTSQIVVTPVKVCDVDNPLTDLPWLKEIVEGWIKREGVYGYVGIYQCNYKDGIGFIVEEQVGEPAFYLINCEGKTLCREGGITGGNACDKFDIDYESIKLIWESRKVRPPQPCEFDDPLIDLNWLKAMVVQTPKLNCDTVRIYQCNYREGIGFFYDQVAWNQCTFYNCRGKRVYFGSRNSIIFRDEDGQDLMVDLENKKLIWEFNR